MARKIGQGFAVVLDETDRAKGSAVVVSRDMRPHSVPLQQALIDGLLDAGLDAVDIGLATTPMSYFAVGHLGAAGGIQVTASHNPAQYNGMKLSRHEARPVSGDHGIPLLEARIESGDLPKGVRRGTVRQAEVMAAYREHMLSFVKPGARLKVVADAANGMGTLYQPLLEAAGIDLIPLYFELDGTFPNHEANPLKAENLRDLCARVQAEKADLGVSFDGDADRAASVDERGEAVGSDLMTALIAGALLERSGGGVVLYDIRSSRAVAEHIRAKGGTPVRERVGHSFMKATLRNRNALFGGELAGHYYFRDHSCADSSLGAVFEVFNLLRSSGKKLSELVAPLARYAKTPEINFHVEDKQEMIDQLSRLYADGTQDRLDGITVEYPTWWFNVRPSNTEPLLRLVMEAQTPAELEQRREELVSMIGDPE
jgi:phosphomannomutase